MAKQMTLDERKRIDFLLQLGWTPVQIAKEMGRSKTTIIREIINRSVAGRAGAVSETVLRDTHGQGNAASPMSKRLMSRRVSRLASLVRAPRPTSPAAGRPLPLMAATSAIPLRLARTLALPADCC